MYRPLVRVAGLATIGKAFHWPATPRTPPRDPNHRSAPTSRLDEREANSRRKILLGGSLPQGQGTERSLRKPIATRTRGAGGTILAERIFAVTKQTPQGDARNSYRSARPSGMTIPTMPSVRRTRMAPRGLCLTPRTISERNNHSASEESATARSECCRVRRGWTSRTG